MQIKTVNGISPFMLMIQFSILRSLGTFVADYVFNVQYFSNVF